MSLRFVLIICWMMPLVVLVPILYEEFRPRSEPVVETNSKMRIRMCREHIDAAKANPDDQDTEDAVAECVTAGYISGSELKTALD